MKEKAIAYYGEGIGCAAAIVKAGAEKYGFCLTKEMEESCSAVNCGFGIGSLCCALVGSVLLFGILLPQEEAKRLRMTLFVQFHEIYGNLDCACLSACRQDCSDVIGTVAELTERLLAEELYI